MSMSKPCNCGSVEVGGRQMTIRKVGRRVADTLRAWDEEAKEQFVRAQTGPAPGPGGLYPEGSQG